jgi:hypothetical protein
VDPPGNDTFLSIPYGSTHVCMDFGSGSTGAAWQAGAGRCNVDSIDEREP